MRYIYRTSNCRFALSDDTGNQFFLRIHEFGKNSYLLAFYY